MPDTAIGALLFVCSAGPGYVFLRTVERRIPTRKRTALFEATEIFIVGSFSTSIALGVVVAFAPRYEWWSPATAVATPLAYLVAEPVRALTAGLVGVTLSWAIAWGLARVSVRGEGATIHGAGSSWHVAFTHQFATAEAFVDVELRDGRRLNGKVWTYSVDDDGPRELVLYPPVYVVSSPDPDGAFSPIGWAVIIPAAEIVLISVQYVKRSPGLADTSSAPRRFMRRCLDRARGQFPRRPAAAPTARSSTRD